MYLIEMWHGIYDPIHMSPPRLPWRVIYNTPLHNNISSPNRAGTLWQYTIVTVNMLVLTCLFERHGEIINRGYVYSCS